MKTILTLIIFISAISSSYSHDDKNVKNIKAKEGKCTGSANCRSCKNCKYCAHCNSGGSCGVCNSSYTETKPKTYKPNSSNKTSTSTNVSGVTQYMVSSNTLNIRKSAATGASIICTLKLGDTLTYIESAGTQWIKVEAICADGKTIIGYAYKKLLVVIGK